MLTFDTLSILGEDMPHNLPLGVHAAPGTRCIRVKEGALTIMARRRPPADNAGDDPTLCLCDEPDPRARSWTTAPIPFPDDVSRGSVVVHAAIALEWSVDMIVSYRDLDGFDRADAWRVGPVGIRARDPLKVNGALREVTYAGLTGRGPAGEALRPQHRFQLHTCDDFAERIYVLEMDPVRFNLRLSLSSQSPRYFDVLISYKVEDSYDFATALNARLREFGLDTWLDREHAMTDYGEGIHSAIERSAHYVVIWSEHSWDDDDDQQPPRAGQPAPHRRLGTQPRTLPRLTQKVEILDIVKECEARRQTTRPLLFICDNDGPLGNLPVELRGRWHHHTRENMAERLRFPDLNETQYIKHLARMIDETLRAYAAAPRETVRVPRNG